MMHWTYLVLTRTGHEQSGFFQGSRQQALDFIKEQKWALVYLYPDYGKIVERFLNQGALPSKALEQFFMDFYNMLKTGMTLPQIMVSLKDTSTNKVLKETLPRIVASMKEGESFTQAIQETGHFPWIVHSTLHAGENTGDLKDTIYILAQYFKRSQELKGKIWNASMYPAIIFIFLIALMLFVSLKVVPSLKTLLPEEALSNPATKIVLSLSLIAQKTWVFLLIALGLSGFLLAHYYQKQKQDLEMFIYNLPLLGPVLKESALAIYFLNLSVLLKSGVPLIRALTQLNDGLSNLMTKKFVLCKDYMLGGLSFWEAVGKDKFFPSVVVFTLRRAEEVTQMQEYCINLSDYFNQRVAARVDQMVHLLQPVLLGIGGLFLIIIALAFLVPIYGSLTKIAGG